jgi:hypothetical protein
MQNASRSSISKWNKAININFLTIVQEDESESLRLANHTCKVIVTSDTSKVSKHETNINIV